MLMWYNFVKYLNFVSIDDRESAITFVFSEIECFLKLNSANCPYLIGNIPILPPPKKKQGNFYHVSLFFYSVCSNV